MKQLITILTGVITIFTLFLLSNRPTEPDTSLISVMNNLAQQKVKDFELSDNWSHSLSNGCDFKCRAKLAGEENIKGNVWLGENLYKGTCDPQLANKLFLESPTHKANLYHENSTTLQVIKPINETDCYIIYIYGKLSQGSDSN